MTSPPAMRAGTSDSPVLSTKHSNFFGYFFSQVICIEVGTFTDIIYSPGIRYHLLKNPGFLTNLLSSDLPKMNCICGNLSKIFIVSQAQDTTDLSEGVSWYTSEHAFFRPGASQKTVRFDEHFHMHLSNYMLNNC